MLKPSYLVNSAIYVIMTFTAGLVWGSRFAVINSILTAGLAVAGADQFLSGRPVLGRSIIIASWAMGLAALASLVWPH